MFWGYSRLQVTNAPRKHGILGWWIALTNSEDKKNSKYPSQREAYKAGPASKSEIKQDTLVIANLVNTSGDLVL